MLNMNYNKCQKYSYRVIFFIFQQISAKLVRSHDRNTMLMQLTEQNSSRQPALMYIKNLCTEMVQII